MEIKKRDCFYIEAVSFVYGFKFIKSEEAAKSPVTSGKMEV
jgi:hypothetical protein